MLLIVTPGGIHAIGRGLMFFWNRVRQLAFQATAIRLEFQLKEK